MRREMTRGIIFFSTITFNNSNFVKEKFVNPLYQWNALPIDRPPL